MIENFVISLDRTPTRLSEFSIQNPHIQFRKFSAVDGRAINKITLIESGLLSSDLRFNDSAIGCALSHLTLWQHSIDINAPITIIEDDCLLHENFQMISQISSEAISDYDLIQWGWNFEGPIEYLHSESTGRIKAMFDHVALCQNPKIFQSHQQAVKLHKVLFYYGATCYTISPAGARKLIGLLLPFKDFYPYLNTKFQYNPGIDSTLNYVHPIINSYVGIYPIAFTLNDKTKSTIPTDYLVGPT
jgi:glycosyl transferase family 25